MNGDGHGLRAGIAFGAFFLNGKHGFPFGLGIAESDGRKKAQFPLSTAPAPQAFLKRADVERMAVQFDGTGHETTAKVIGFALAAAPVNETVERLDCRPAKLALKRRDHDGGALGGVRSTTFCIA